MTGRRSPWGDDKEPEAAGEAGDNEPSAAQEGGATPDDAGEPSAKDGSKESGAAGNSETGRGETGKGAPRNPWLPSSDEKPTRRSASIEDIFRARKDGGRGGSGRPGSGGFGIGNAPEFLRLPQRPNGKSWIPLIVAGVFAVWLLTTSAHELGTTEQGVVTTFGKYTRTIGPGVSFTLPWPVENVSVADVTSIRRDSIPDGDAEKLMLTSDQNLVDLSYLVRWNISDLKQYSFQLDDPDTAVRNVAEAAMRASVAEVKLSDVMGGNGRAYIEQSVRTRMQAVLDAYHAGVLVQGVDIKKADPPDKVNDAFQQVSAAQQGANRDISRAQGIAQQLIAQAQGSATAFDKVYAQYKLSPEVTRRRMYYETMERVLSANDKVIVEGNTTSYLPLPEVKRSTPQPDSSQNGSQGQ